MRPPDMGTIERSVKNARIAWEHTGQYWSDSVKERFQELHWDPFLEQIEATIRAMQELNEVLVKAERDCRA